MLVFVETLLREKLELPQGPLSDAPSRSIMVKRLSYMGKEDLIKIAWQKRGFMHKGRKVFLDYNYAPDVVNRRKEYTEAKKNTEREEDTFSS